MSCSFTLSKASNAFTTVMFLTLNPSLILKGNYKMNIIFSQELTTIRTLTFFFRGFDDEVPEKKQYYHLDKHVNISICTYSKSMALLKIFTFILKTI